MTGRALTLAFRLLYTAAAASIVPLSSGCLSDPWYPTYVIDLETDADLHAMVRPRGEGYDYDGVAVGSGGSVIVWRDDYNPDTGALLPYRKHDLVGTADLHAVWVDGSVWWVVGDAGSAAVTIDAGDAWTPVDVGTTANLRGITGVGSRLVAAGRRSQVAGRRSQARLPACGPVAFRQAASIGPFGDITNEFRGMSLAHAGPVPQTLHQAVVRVFRDDPPLAFDLVRSVFDIELPAFDEIQDRKSDLDRFAPCVGDTGELRPDLALSAMVRQTRRARHARKVRCGFGMLLEVQRRIARLKRWRIWVYWALLAEYLQLTTIVMVVALTDAVSRWARSLGESEVPRRDCLLVLDRQNMPRIVDIDQARQRPSMAVLSALLHKGDLEVLRTAFEIALELPDERRWVYASALLGVAPEVERVKLLDEIEMEERYQLTRAERNSIAFHDGRAEGKRLGERVGERKGLRKGEREGERKGLVKLVLTICELRKIPVSRRAKVRLRTCMDLEQLERWAARAKRASSIHEILD